jgi:hypothetical protein
MVGGYGAVKLAGWDFQPLRKIGKNKIRRFDEKVICINGATIKEDGVKVRGKKAGCMPIGQDSGSAFFLGGKIRGVFASSKEEWKGELTIVKEGCAVNLSNPEVKVFIEDTLHSKPVATKQENKEEFRSSETGKGEQ